MTKFYIDAQGNYIGGFDGAEPQQGAIEVANPPAHGLDKWAGNKWVAYVAPKAYKPLSPAQVRLVLDQFGLLAQVESAVAVGDKKLKIEWEFRTEFARDNATLLSMATALGMTATQVDSMFEVGATL